MPGRVVIADDEPHILALLRVTLREFELVEASDGEAALAAIREHRPAVVIADGNMPGMDGYALTQAVRADTTLPQPHIVILTASARELDRQRASEVGVDELMTKPFRPTALRARVAELVGD